MKRTGLSGPTYSSSDSGSSSVWDRSGPVMCGMIRILPHPASIPESVAGQFSHGLQDPRHGARFHPAAAGRTCRRHASPPCSSRTVLLLRSLRSEIRRSLRDGDPEKSVEPLRMLSDLVTAHLPEVPAELQRVAEVDKIQQIM